MPLNIRPFHAFLHPRPLPSPIPIPRTLTPTTFLRPASHASEGRANGSRSSRGKRLGSKKSSQQFVVPGNIIFRQRGTLWYPGENCGMGRDHTIFAKEKGYVVFYRDPEQLSVGVGAPGYGGEGGVVGKRKVREKRRYIGVVLERGQTLPRGRGEKRVRRLGLEGREMSTLAAPSATESIDTVVPGAGDTVPETNEEGGPVLLDATKEARKKLAEMKEMGIRPGYMFREANWQIGRAEDKNGKTVRVYQKGDRFLAWRKRNARQARAAEKRALRGSGKKKTGRK
ncbi:MAG: hypothetical protein Q9186_003442 [Xanthomendoza sp. 1 TL-2023]